MRSDYEIREIMRLSGLRGFDRDRQTYFADSGVAITQKNICNSENQNFSSLCFCIQPTHCKLQAVVGPGNAAFPRYYFDQDKRDCSKFIYGGACGNYNNFRTYKECMKQCKCEKIC